MDIQQLMARLNQMMDNHTVADMNERFSSSSTFQQQHQQSTPPAPALEWATGIRRAKRNELSVNLHLCTGSAGSSTENKVHR